MKVTCNGDDEMPDGKPGKLTFASLGCGREIDIGDGEPWDVKTDDGDGVGTVVSRHRQVTCAHCGVTTWVREDYPGQSEQADAERAEES